MILSLRKLSFILVGFGLAVGTLAPLFGGAITTITKTSLPNKQILLFHDYHQCGDNAITRHGTSYKVRDVATWQKEAFEPLLSDLFEKRSAAVCLEWRSTLYWPFYKSVTGAARAHNYNVSALHEWQNSEDFFCHHFCWQLMCPIKDEHKEKVQRCSKVINCDTRDALHDAAFDLFFYGQQLFDAHQEIKMGTQDPQAKKRYEGKRSEFQKLVESKNVADASDWINYFEKQLQSKAEKLKAHVPNNLYVKIVEKIDRKKKILAKKLQQFAGTQVTAQVGQSILKKHTDAAWRSAFEQSYQAFLDYACQLVDMEILFHIYTTDQELVVVYCGHSHAEVINNYLKTAGLKLSAMDLFKPELMKLKADKLEHKISQFISTHEAKIANSKTFIQTALDEIWAFFVRPAHQSVSVQTDSTFLHMAAQRGDQEMIKFLLDECHADPQALDAEGKTSFEVAAQSHPECASLLKIS